MIKVLRAMKYKDCPVYIRMIGGQVFMYDLIFKNQIYSSYMIINPAKGKEKLTPSEIQSSMMMINAGAEATIDSLLGVKLDKETESRAKAVLSAN